MDLGAGGRRLLPRRPADPAFAAVAAVLLVTAGLFALLPGTTGPPLEPVAFSEVPAGVEAEAGLIDHTCTETVLVVSGLEEGKTYRLILRDVGGEAVPSGAFIGTGDRPSNAERTRRCCGRMRPASRSARPGGS